MRISSVESIQSKKQVIECYTPPLAGHAFPLLKIIEIIAKKHPQYEIKLLASAFYIQELQPKFPHIKMEGIQDGLTVQTFQDKITMKKIFEPLFKLIVHGISIATPVFRMHEQYFQKKQNRPDLFICDFFGESCMRFAKTNKIKCIIVNPIPYGSIRDCFGFPSFDKGISLAGLTILYPKLFNPSEFLGFFNIPKAFKHNSRLVILSSLGLESGTTMPTNHSFVGLLSNTIKFKKQIDQQLANWIEEWKKQGNRSFIYISFGTLINLQQKFALQLKKIIQKLGYPTIWSLRADYGSKLDSKYIFHRLWFPQEAILALPQIKCYVSHCGWGSVTEAVASQKPLICIPSFGDQPYNAELVDAKKIGIQIYKPKIPIPAQSFLPEISDQRLTSAFQQVITDQTYMNNIKRINKICRNDKTDQNVNRIVEETLEFGYQHLIDHSFQEHTGKSLISKAKWLLFILVVFAVYFSFMTGEQNSFKRMRS